MEGQVRDCRAAAEHPEEGQGAEGQIRDRGAAVSKPGRLRREGLAFRQGAVLTKKTLGQRSQTI